MADGSVVAFDIGILLRLARLDVLDGNAPGFRPTQQLPADVLRAIVHPDRKRWTPPFDDPIKAADEVVRLLRTEAKVI